MKSITSCIMKAGKALNSADASAIKEIYASYTSGGMQGPEAADKAVADYLEVLDQEYKDVLAAAVERGADPSQARSGVVYAQGSETQHLSKSLSIVDLLYGQETLPTSKKTTTRELARILTARARKLNRGKPFSSHTERNKEILAETIAIETAAAMQRTGHAGNWYSQVLRDAVAVAGELHPEINADVNARTAFLFALAITSNGADVATNTTQAELVYSEYKRKKKFPIFGKGPEAESMRKAFKLFNELNAKWGLDNLARFMNTEFTVKELGTLGLKVNGENADTKVYGSAIFGPKIGQGFFQNLMGNFQPLTMDRWWMRTWGRMVGNLAPEGLPAAQKQREAFLAALPGNEELLKDLGYTVAEVNGSDRAMLDLARKLHRIYASGNFKDKSAINKAAKLLDSAVNDPVVAPRNGTERNWIREVVARAQEKLAARGISTDTASLQALLWYPEKEFYLKNGVGNERAKPTDYAKEFTKLAISRGVTKSGVAAAIARGRDRFAAADVAAAGEPSVTAGRGAALAAKARKQLIQEAAIRFIRHAEGPTYSGRAPKGAARSVGNATVKAIHVPGKKVANRLETADLAAPSFLELHRTTDSAQHFHAAISKASKAHPLGVAVEIKSPEEYENMRLFITDDGMAGFALDGSDIVSVFKNPKASKLPGVSHMALRLAVQEGGRTLDTFDTYGPHLYAQQGFVPASRVPFNEEMAPDNWSKEAFKSFNGGKPDVVFMVYDSTSFDQYDGGGQVFTEWQDGKDAQLAAMDALTKRNRVLYRLEDEPTPLTQTQRLAATVEAQRLNAAKDGGSFKRSISSALAGKNAKNLQTALAAIPRRNLQDFVSKEEMPAAGEYIRIANRMDGRRNELLAEHETLGKRWSEFTSKNKDQARILGELMHAATLAGVDPSKPYKALMDRKNMSPGDMAIDAKRRADHTLLKKWWDERLVQEGRDIYTAVAEAYKNQRKLVEEALERRITETKADPKAKQTLLTELRQKFEAGRVTGVYFPLTRFGDLWASAKDADGNVVSFSKFETVKEQKEWKAEFAAMGYTVDGGTRMDDGAIARTLDPKFVAKVTSLVEGVDKELADEIWQMYLRSMPEMAARKQFIHRKGRLGFSADAIRGFGYHMFHGSHQAAKLEYMYQMTDKLAEIKEQARAMEQADSKDALWGAAVYNEMVKRHEWARNPKASSIASALTSLGFAWYLGATPAAAMVNLTQTAIVAYPVLAAKFSWLKAGLELNRGFALWATSKGDIANRLRGDELEAVREANRIGLFDKTQSHDLAALAESGKDYSSKREKAMQIISWMFHKAEEANRQVTFLAAYRMGRSEGMSHDDAVNVAEDLTWDSHFDYNNANRPRIMQNDAAKVLLLFRQYSMNMTYRLARDFRESFKEGDPELRSEARQRLGGILMMTSIFAGATGLPLTWAVTAIINSLMGDEDEPYDAQAALYTHLSELYGPDAASMIMTGAWDTVVGGSISTRVSLNNLWIQETPPNLEGADLFAHYLGQLAGPMGGIVSNVFVGAQRVGEGQFERAAELFVPKMVKDLMKTYRYSQEGVTNLRGDEILPREYLSDWDLTLQAMGFTPTTVNQHYAQNRAVGGEAKKLENRRSELMDKFYMSTVQNDGEVIRETIQEILRFNKANPGIMIDVKNLRASAKTRTRYSQRSVGGLTLKPGLNYLHQKYKLAQEKKAGE